ncbi:hypothetical protein T484DRAFT_1745441 [Baffinella frigidus]|nr:hypothetical protein T484DRAFT_1745441 [Cryptophyta sp. CCMP2293]
MRPDKRSRRPGQSAVAALVLSLSRRCLLSMAVLFLILTLALKQILVDEQGFAYVLIQCIFKVFHPLPTAPCDAPHLCSGNGHSPRGNGSGGPLTRDPVSGRQSYASLDTYSREPSGPGRAEYANVTQASAP